jgi:hypothetical protein
MPERQPSRRLPVRDEAGQCTVPWALRDQITNLQAENATFSNQAARRAGQKRSATGHQFASSPRH